ncbi:hypothetical protein [Streptococcus parasuis]|uniref:hypothetical protein n=1 Tax=Streptococcus parasuis TaxID=1501662 RepID=UPI0028A700E0|nr:hypothetical protein [Streptococcus parasuis]
MTTLFINSSPNKNGNTVALVKRLLRNQEYETLHLTDYKIYDYGQDFFDDQFKEVICSLSPEKIQNYLLKKSVRGCFSYRQLKEIFV